MSESVDRCEACGQPNHRYSYWDDEIKMTFDGPATADGTMDARLLAEAMLAMQDLMDAVADEMGQPRVELKVKSFSGTPEPTEQEASE